MTRSATKFAAAAAVTAGLWGAPAAWAQAAGDFMEYTVQAGDTCIGVAKWVLGDPKKIVLLHELNALGPPPHHLQAGQVLRLPRVKAGAPTPAGPDAQLTFLRNEVEAYTPERHRGQLNEPLLRGHQVGTLAESSAEVTFADETQLYLGEHTLVVILGRSGEHQPRESSTTLMTGSLRAFLNGMPRGARPLNLSTPAAQVALGAGEAQVQVDPAKTTRLSVYRGRSEIEAQRRRVQVPEGFGSRAAQGAPPTTPRPLPAAPVWLESPPEVVLTADERAAVYGRYGVGKSGPQVAQWRVQVARDGRFRDLVADTRVPVTVDRLEARGLPPGGYFARVSAIDADGFEGPAGAAAAVQVGRVQVQAGRLLVTPGLACGLDGAAPQAVAGPLEVDPARPHELRCGAGTVLIPAAPVVAKAPAPVPVVPAPVPVAPPVPAPVVTAAPAPVSTRAAWIELGVVQSLFFYDSHRQSAVGGGAELGLLVRLGKLSLGIGARLGAETLGDGNPGLAAALPLSLRLGPPEARFRPYVAFSPGLLSQAADAGGQARLTLGGAGGGEIRLGPGALFLELGYRHVFSANPGGALSEALGYRLRL